MEEVEAAWTQVEAVWVQMLVLLSGSAYFVPTGKLLDFSELQFFSFIKGLLKIPILNSYCENPVK